MTLHRLPVGHSGRISAVADQPLAVRMQSMGIREGAAVTMVAHAASGSRLVRVGDARLTLAKELCLAIEVADVR